MLTQKRLRQVLDYNPETGVFVWRLSLSPRSMAGTVARDIDPLGYRRISIDRTRYRAHRLAWLYCHGAWPTKDIDHINGDPSDNRIANLREATQSQNHANQRKKSTNTSGYKGVSWSPNPKLRLKPWTARIKANGRNKHLGQFPTPEEAHAAYVAAAKRFFGEFARAE